MRAAAAATLAALPPRRRWIRAAVSVPRAGGPAAWMTTSSSRSPTTPSTERSYHGPRYRLPFRQRESPRGNRGLCGLRGSASAGRRSPFIFGLGHYLTTPRRASMVEWRDPTRRRRPPRSPWPSTCSSRPSAATTRRERRRAHRLGALLADDAGREFLFALTDRVLRTPPPARAMQQLRDLVDAGLPDSLPRLDRAGLRLAALGSTVAPRPVAAIARRRIRSETRGVIVPADDPAFRRHRRPAARGGLRRQRQPARRGDRRRRRGRRPPRRAVRANAPAGRRLRLGEDLGAVRQPRRARLRSRGRAHRRTPAHGLRRRRRELAAGLRQPRHGGVPRPPAHGGGVLPSARRAALHPAPRRDRLAGVPARHPRRARATRPLGHRPAAAGRRPDQGAVGEGGQPGDGARRRRAGRLGAGDLRHQGRRGRRASRPSSTAASTPPPTADCSSGWAATTSSTSGGRSPSDAIGASRTR